MKVVVINLLCIFVSVTGIPATQPSQIPNKKLIENTALHIPRLNNRIVEGVNAEISSYPYQLSLEYLGSHSCGAALISPTWAITAAHCTDGIFTRFLTVRAGSTYAGKGGQVVKVKNKIIHPRYDRRLIDYDVALLELSEPITNSAARTVALPERRIILVEGTWATVTGWGTLNENGNLAKQLQALDVPLISQVKCRKLYGGSSITDRMFCAGYEEGGKDSCQGDSGGPLVSNGVLIGIVSWGYGCARQGYPGVYTNVQSVRKFIKNNSRI